jgi:hypothetical protein
MKGTTFTLDVEENDDIELVKLKIEDKEGVPVGRQRLIWAGRQLENGRTPRFYAKTFHQDTLHLALRQRGGGVFDDCVKQVATSTCRAVAPTTRRQTCWVSSSASWTESETLSLAECASRKGASASLRLVDLHRLLARLPGSPSSASPVAGVHCQVHLLRECGRPPRSRGYARDHALEALSHVRQLLCVSVTD